MTDSTTPVRATLSCKHVVDIHPVSGVGEDGKVACEKCPQTKSGASPRRAIKSTVEAPAAAEQPAEPAETAATPSAELPVLTELMSSIGQTGQPSNVSDMTKARTERLRRAKEAAASGGDAAAVLAEPLPENKGKRRSGGRTRTRVCFLNLTPVRIAAMLAAGFPQDRLEASTVDLQVDDVRTLLASLPKVCADDTLEKGVQPAACRLADWLERFRQEVEAG